MIETTLFAKKIDVHKFLQRTTRTESCYFSSLHQLWNGDHSRETLLPTKLLLSCKQRDLSRQQLLDLAVPCEVVFNMDSRCEIEIDELVEHPEELINDFTPFHEIKTILMEFKQRPNEKAHFEVLLQKKLYTMFYADFCLYHKVGTQHAFEELRGGDGYVRVSDIVNVETVQLFLGMRALSCKLFVSNKLRCGDRPRPVGKETTVGGLIALLWPRTFVVKGSDIGPDGSRQRSTVLEMQTVLAALPPRYKDDAFAKMPPGISKKERSQMRAQVEATVERTKGSRINDLKTIIMSKLEQAPRYHWAYEPNFRQSRLLVDRAVMEMFCDTHNELCPCCYMSLVEGTTYIDYSASAREMKTCHSHILSAHYLTSLGVSAMSDLRLDSKIVSNPKSMAFGLLCTTCDNKQGEWEGLIKNKESNYNDIVHLYWYGCTRDGRKDSIEFKSERNLFRFLVPNIYRMCLLQIDSSSSSHIVSYCDVLRQCMHKFLIFTDSSAETTPFYMYVFVVNANIFVNLENCWSVFNSVPTIDFDYALSIVPHLVCLGGKSIGVLIAPFVVCISTEEIPKYSNFLVTDTTESRVLAFPTVCDSSCISYIAHVIQRAYQSELLAEKNFPERLKAEKTEFLSKPTKLSEPMPAALLLELICGYISSKNVHVGGLGPFGREMYLFYLNCFQNGKYCTAESSVVLTKIRLLDSDMELRSVCINYFSPHATVVQKLFDFFDKM